MTSNDDHFLKNYYSTPTHKHRKPKRQPLYNAECNFTCKFKIYYYNLSYNFLFPQVSSLCLSHTAAETELNTQHPLPVDIHTNIALRKCIQRKYFGPCDLRKKNSCVIYEMFMVGCFYTACIPYKDIICFHMHDLNSLDI